MGQVWMSRQFDAIAYCYHYCLLHEMRNYFASTLFPMLRTQQRHVPLLLFIGHDWGSH